MNAKLILQKVWEFIKWSFERFPIISLIVVVIVLGKLAGTWYNYRVEQDKINKQNEFRVADSLRKLELISQWGPNYKFRMDSAIKVEQEASQKEFDKKRKLEAERASKAEKEYVQQQRKRYGEKVYKVWKKHPEWSWEVCDDVAHRRYWIGMSYEMLLESRGKPNHVNTSNYGTGESYQVCWDDWNPSCFYFGEDHIVKSYN